MEKKLLTSTKIEIRWVDLDAYNHLNNAKYYDFMTESRSKALWELKDECGYVVLENSCKYKKPVSYPSIITVEQYIYNITTTSFELFYLFKDHAEVTIAEGNAKMVCFDLIKNRPVKIPVNVKSLFDK